MKLISYIKVENLKTNFYRRVSQMKIFKKITNVVSWILLIALGLMTIYTFAAAFQARQNKQDFYLFDYRPGIILTGSMEPTIREGGMTISKKVYSIDELQKNDIITFHIWDEDNREYVKITHRIVQITDDGKVYTKGDNNQVVDNYYSTMDNIESKTVKIWNWFARVHHLWWFGGIPGKIAVLCPLVFLICCSFLIDLKRKEAEERKQLKEMEEFKDNVMELAMNEKDAEKTENPSSTEAKPNDKGPADE